MIRRGAAHLLPIGSATFLIVLAACGGDAVTPLGDTSPVVSSVKLKPCGCFTAPASSDRTIGVLGMKLRISAEALAEDGTVLFASSESPSRFSWSSSAPNVATVEVTPGPFGGFRALLTGLSEGTATITVTSGGLSDEMTVTVRDRARLAWTVPLDSASRGGGIAIGADGTIYVVTPRRLFAISPEGAVRWTQDLSRSSNAPAIGADGTLYMTERDGGLIAMSPGGTVRWTLEGLEDLRSLPAIGPDGTIYVAGLSNVYAVDPTGALRWAYQATGRVFAFSSPAVASDGTVYIGATNGRLHAINADGSERWTFDTGEKNVIYSAPSIDTEGTIYFGSLSGLFAVGPDGTGGRLLLNRTVHKSPAIGQDGTIYVGTDGGSGGIGVFAIGPSGAVRWSSTPAATTTPILGADGSVYVTATGLSGEPVIAALDSQGRLLWDYVAPGDPGSLGGASPAMTVDGKILAVSVNPNVLYAIVENGSTNGGHAGSPWPTARGDRANTGHARTRP
jgi:outer membrane protein assembly factor BamB